MAECGALDISCKIGEGAGKAVGTVLDMMTQDIQASIEKMTGMLTTFWTRVPTGVIAADTGVTAFLNNHLAFFTGCAAIVSILIGAAKMALTQRSQAGVETASGFVQLVLIALFGVPLISGLTYIADTTSIWLVDSAITEGDFGSNMVALLITGSGGGPVVGFFSMLWMGVLAMGASLIQAALMIVRSLMLPILAGTLTLSAAFWTTESGKLWFKRSITWLIAFLAYKPAAAIIYAAGFTLMGDKKILTSGSLDEYGRAMFSFICGIGVMGLAIIALPAMISFAIPVAGKLSSGGGGGFATGAAVAGTVAAGAISNGSSTKHENTSAGPVGANPASAAPSTTPGGAAPGGPGGSGAPGASAGAGPSGPKGGTTTGASGASGAAGAAGSTGAAAATGGVTKGIEVGAKAAGAAAQHARSTAEGATGNGDQA